MATQTQPNPGRRLGFIFVDLGIGVWFVGGVLFLGNLTGLLATIPYAGFVTTLVGAFFQAVGVSFMCRPRHSALKRRTSLLAVVPALLLFILMLLGSTLWFGGNLEHPTTAGRWIASTVTLLLSTAIVFALFRDVLLRFHDAVPRWRYNRRYHRWHFSPRWKDELACASPDGQLVLGMSFEPHVYFPTNDVWARHAPSWAKDRRPELLVELEQWCMAYGIPLTVDERASVEVC